MEVAGWIILRQWRDSNIFWFRLCKGAETRVLGLPAVEVEASKYLSKYRMLKWKLAP